MEPKTTVLAVCCLLDYGGTIAMVPGEHGVQIEQCQEQQYRLGLCETGPSKVDDVKCLPAKTKAERDG